MSPASVGSQTPTAEIVAAGNEVLPGDVLDSNSHLLCRRVTALGGAVTRVVLVRDDLEAIAAEVRGVLQRAPALVFTVGGLGPTADDMTLEGLALGLEVPLELHPGAERLVRAAYTRFAAAGLVPFAEMNEARLKMAHLPRGAAPVVNPWAARRGSSTNVAPRPSSRCRAYLRSSPPSSSSRCLRPSTGSSASPTTRSAHWPSTCRTSRRSPASSAPSNAPTPRSTSSRAPRSWGRP